MNFCGNIQKDEKLLRRSVCGDDIKFLRFEISGHNAVAVYTDSICDKELLGREVVNPLFKYKGDYTLEKLKEVSLIAVTASGADVKQAAEQLLDGSAVILADGIKGFFAADLKKFEVRAVAEPPLQTVMRGPREGFNECIKTNLSLMRRRIKSPSLSVTTLSVGRLSKTAVAVLYIKNVADKKLADGVIEKIKNIDIDNVSDSSYIAKLISTHKGSIFKMINDSEKPDVVAARLAEGRIAVIVDGSPIVLTLPYLLIEDFQNPEDYYANTIRSNFVRWIRVCALAFSVLLPAFYVASQLFHLQFIPLNFLLTIVNSIKGIPMSPSFEMFFILLIFEILNEASVRMPKYAGMALSIVGALVLGDTAVRAGIVSSPAILIMALSAISLYTVPELVETMSIIRITLLIVAGSVGGYGIILGIIFIINYLCAAESFGTPILAPFAPLVPEDLKDTFYISYLSEMQKRPRSIRNINPRRMKFSVGYKNTDKP
ncbi:MAG: spore germination protein [Candidatus Borkfalkiaceae bacterium]|nr:spore germination protein [bacterium]MDY2851874.1 spore germination protein [Christensenellaceae bacterium]